MIRYIDAQAQWDDRDQVFRVFLTPESTCKDPDPETVPLQQVYAPGYGASELMCRLYRAAFVRCPKDIGRLAAQDAVLGFSEAAAAKRVAKAVKKELAAIDTGQPAPSDDAVRLAIALAQD